MCREHGLLLSVLAAHPSNPLEGFGLFGVIKETGVDDEGLIEFASKYFNYPLYLDKDWSLYKALGDRTQSVLPMLGNILWNMRSYSARLKANGIENNLVGEGMKLGGVILFDKDGVAKYAWLEDVDTKELPVDKIAAAAKQMRG